MIPYTVRPLDPWVGPRTADRRKSPFGRVTLTSTLALMSHELRQIGADRWVLQIDVEERWINKDGTLHARANPFSPAIRVSFTSQHGPLMYATDRFEQWQINLRAVAMALESLRRVERFGVAGSGEQYRGFTAISNRPAEMSREQAAEFIAEWAVIDQFPAHVILSSHVALQNAYRLAAKRAHPDVTGDDGDTMARLNAARDLLLAGGNHG